MRNPHHQTIYGGCGWFDAHHVSGWGSMNVIAYSTKQFSDIV
jgi:hypothetical protein